MSITEIQMNNFVLAVKVGLSVLKRPLPMTPLNGRMPITISRKSLHIRKGAGKLCPFSVPS